jgi:hypothetical protein
VFVPPGWSDALGMAMRFLSAGLWLLSALYAGSLLHGVAGTPELLGPVVGLTSAGLIVARPLRRPATGRATVPAPSTVTGPRTLSGPV